MEDVVGRWWGNSAHAVKKERTGRFQRRMNEKRRAATSEKWNYDAGSMCNDGEQ